MEDQMNPHQNARSCVYSRELIIKRVLEEGVRPRAVATALGLSERTVYKWLGRYKEEGYVGLQNRSSCPHHMPGKTAAGLEQAILHLRRTFLLTAQAIAKVLKLALSTVFAILKRHGISRKKDLAPKETIIRYEKKAPGDMIHIDIKKLGRIEGVGHRITGDRKGQSAPRSRKKGGHGWEYLHIAIDDYSRIAYAEILPDETRKSCLTFLINALRFFRTHKISVASIMTDNGVSFRSHRYRKALRMLNIAHKRTRPYTPKTNGKAERFIKTCINEWAYSQAYQHSQERLEALPIFLDFYNYQRYHSAIHQTPMDRKKTPEQPAKTLHLERFSLKLLS
jgi:transposase InsO family protein